MRRLAVSQTRVDLQIVAPAFQFIWPVAVAARPVDVRGKPAIEFLNKARFAEAVIREQDHNRWKLVVYSPCPLSAKAAKFFVATAKDRFFHFSCALTNNKLSLAKTSVTRQHEWRSL